MLVEKVGVVIEDFPDMSLFSPTPTPSEAEEDESEKAAYWFLFKNVTTKDQLSVPRNDGLI